MNLLQQDTTFSEEIARIYSSSKPIQWDVLTAYFNKFKLIHFANFKNFIFSFLIATEVSIFHRDYFFLLPILIIEHFSID